MDEEVPGATLISPKIPTLSYVLRREPDGINDILLSPCATLFQTANVPMHVELLSCLLIPEHTPRKAMCWTPLKVLITSIFAKASSKLLYVSAFEKDVWS